jgi:hypothetical protein
VEVHVRPESVEIKVTVAGDQVGTAISALDLAGGTRWSILFCEDVTAGAASTPLLDLGVILRARRKSQTKGDSTVKLRPCRWSQLDPEHFANSDDGVTELKIEADWTGPARHLTASMTADWSGQRWARVQANDEPPAELFSRQQREFLERCGGGRINLTALTALPSFAATRWDAFPATEDGVDLSVRAERWTVDGAGDYLELSIVSTVEQGAADQDALQSFLAGKGLSADDSQQNKTERVLAALVAQAAAGRLRPPPGDAVR